jgi:hypothetical protein
VCKKGRYARAKEILIEMLNIGPSSDTTTHNTLPVAAVEKTILLKLKKFLVKCYVEVLFLI